MKVKKPTSKRVPVRLRHKIEKASLAKQRKLKKEAKKNPQWRSRLKKDPGIPNLFPYKAKILAEIEERKRTREEELIKKRETAKARRNGQLITDPGSTNISSHEDGADGEIDGEADLDQDDEDEDDVDEDMEDDSSNPMAALLESAQVRANKYLQEEPGQDSTTMTSDRPDAATRAQQSQTNDIAKAAEQHSKKVLPKQAREDPIKVVSLLIARLNSTSSGLDQVIGYYGLPPLATAGNEISSRLLVEVARKRGRLGKGGVPNIHAAALLLLNDINDERLLLPSVANTPNAAVNKNGDVKIVNKLAAPFRLEGLWESKARETTSGGEMIVDD